MRDYSIKEFSDFIYEVMKPLKYEMILTNPSTRGKYPCIELHTPLKSVTKTTNAFPVFSRFQISLTCWSAKQRDAMQMSQEIETALQKINLIKTSSSQSQYDSVLQKYGITSFFEVNYNGIIDAFEIIK